jgi:hypothetical protein
MDTFPAIDWLTPNCVYTLTGAVTAFRASPDALAADRCGPICELPDGADLTVCGGGFNKRPVRVRYGDCDYYVFWRDLASASSLDQTEKAAEPMALLQLAEAVGRHGQAATVEVPSQTPHGS